MLGLDLQSSAVWRVRARIANQHEVLGLDLKSSAVWCICCGIIDQHKVFGLGLESQAALFCFCICQSHKVLRLDLKSSAVRCKRCGVVVDQHELFGLELKSGAVWSVCGGIVNKHKVLGLDNDSSASLFRFGVGQHHERSRLDLQSSSISTCVARQHELFGLDLKGGAVWSICGGIVNKHKVGTLDLQSGTGCSGAFGGTEAWSSKSYRARCHPVHAQENEISRKRRYIASACEWASIPDRK